ncbi:MAG: hypothetical protein ACI8RZ_006314 [Myxococcota bacterium]|jgi:hypothetical protein
MTDRDRLLDRVRKLLALAESPNIHEAALAASRAQTLIDAHRLQGLLDAEEDAPVTDGRSEPLESGRRLRKWKVVLAGALADLNGCLVYTDRAGKMKHIVLVGTDEDRAAVGALWDWLVKRIEWLSATHGSGQDRSWHDAFRIGAAQTIAARLRIGREAGRAKLESTALVVVTEGLARRQTRVSDYARDNLNLKPGRGIRVDPDAFRQGQQAGSTVALPK